MSNIRQRWVIFAVAGMPILVLGIAAAISLPSASKSNVTDAATVYALKKIGRGLEHYARDHGGTLPSTLQDSGAGEIPLDPLSGGEFIYVGGGVPWINTSEDHSQRVIAYTRNQESDRHQYALFSDGAVIRISERDLADALHKTAASPESR